MAGELAPRLDELTRLAREDPAAAHQAVQETGLDTGMQAELAALMLGAALAALDDYEAFVRSRITEPAPAAAGDPETDRRRWLGIAIGKLETARHILSEAALALDRETELWVLSRQAARLAYTTVQDLLVPAGGSGTDSQRLDASLDLMVTLWGHPAGADEDQALRRLAAERLQAGALE